jgi:hypothetical protein
MCKKTESEVTKCFCVQNFRFFQKKSPKSEHRGGAEFGTHGLKNLEISLF